MSGQKLTAEAQRTQRGAEGMLQGDLSDEAFAWWKRLIFPVFTAMRKHGIGAMRLERLPGEKVRFALDPEGDAALPKSEITWHPESEKPDDSLTVLVGFADGGAECGFWDSEFSCWRSVDGMRFNEKLTHWADLPAVPASALSASSAPLRLKKGARA